MAIKEVSTREEFDALPDGTVFYDPRHGTFREKRYNEEVGDFEAVTVNDPQRQDEILQGASPELQQRATADRERRAVEGFPSQITAARTRSPLRTRDRVALETVGSGKPEDAAWFLENTELYDVKRGPDGDYFYRIKGSPEWGVIDPEGWQGMDEFVLDLSHYVSKILTTGAAGAKGAAVGFVQGLKGGKPGALLGTILGGASGGAAGELMRQQIGVNLGVNPPAAPETLDPELGPVGLGEAAGDVVGGMANSEVGAEALWGGVPFDLAAKGLGKALFPTGKVKEAIRPIHNVPRELPQYGHQNVASRGALIDRDAAVAQREILNHGPASARVRADSVRTTADDHLREGQRAADYQSLSSRFRQGEQLSEEDLLRLAQLEVLVDTKRLVPVRPNAFLEAAERGRHKAGVVDVGISASGKRGSVASWLYQEPMVENNAFWRNPMPWGKAVPYGSKDAVMDTWENQHPESKQAVGDALKRVPGLVGDASKGVPGLMAPRDARADAPPENFVMRRDPAVRPGGEPVPAEIDPYQAALDELAAGSQVGELPPLSEAQEGEDFFYNEDGELVINIRGGRGKPEKPKKKGVEALMSR